jgi:hypothetical protein
VEIEEKELCGLVYWIGAGKEKWRQKERKIFWERFLLM